METGLNPCPSILHYFIFLKSCLLVILHASLGILQMFNQLESFFGIKACFISCKVADLEIQASSLTAAL